MELPVVWWAFIISQIFGLVNIIIAFIKFQYKDKAKTLRLSAIGNVFKSLNYIFLLNWSLAGLKVISIFKNLFFAKTSKGDVKLWKSILGFVIFSLISTGVVFWAWWYSREWFEWVILGVVLFANFGKWVKGIHILRTSQLVYRLAMIYNSIFVFLNPTNLIKAVAVITSIIIFYIRLLREKCKKKKDSVEEIQPEPIAELNDLENEQQGISV